MKVIVYLIIILLPVYVCGANVYVPNACVQPAIRAKFCERQLLFWAQTVILWDQIELFIDNQSTGGRI